MRIELLTGDAVAEPVASLLDRIRTKQARVGIVGLGYVGLPVAVEFARAGFAVTGLDLDTAKVEQVNAGRSYIRDVADCDVAKLVESGHLHATTDTGRLADLDVIDICVPTPLRKTRDPDLSFVVSALQGATPHLRVGQLVILESTTYPGTTEEIVRPMLEATGLKVGTDLLVAFSPERIDPGNQQFTTRMIPKVVGGVNEQSTEAAVAFYRQIVDVVVPVSSPAVAEMVKLLENTFRAVNIGLVNEIALMCRSLKIDVWEVIDAASTKPFGFMPFYPGPGLGGHCIPVDPFYLSWKARQSGFESRFIELAGYVNGAMPHHVFTRITEALNSRALAVRGARVHVLGVAYKPDVGDIRESPALDIIHLLAKHGAVVSYSDPHVPVLREDGLDLEAIDVDCALDRGVDCAVVVTNHRGFDYLRIAERAPLVVDTRNALRGIEGAHISRL